MFRLKAAIKKIIAVRSSLIRHLRSERVLVNHINQFTYRSIYFVQLTIGDETDGIGWGGEVKGEGK